jgi:esterase/lipase
MNEVIISPMIQNAIVLLMGGIVTGLGTLVALLLSQRRDVKKLLDISTVFSENINTLNPCVKKILSVAKYHNTAFREVIREDDATALQSVCSAMEGIKEVESILDARYDANSEAAMAVGGGR